MRTPDEEFNDSMDDAFRRMNWNVQHTDPELWRDLKRASTKFGFLHVIQTLKNIADATQTMYMAKQQQGEGAQDSATEYDAEISYLDRVQMVCDHAIGTLLLAEESKNAKLALHLATGGK
jgi:hypothetical protein